MIKNYFDLTGQTAVVTGASTGLGVQMAKALANQGCNIVAMARRQNLIDDVAAEIAKEYGVKAVGIRCDITDTESVDSAVDAALAEFGRIDILINNAGICKCLPLEETEKNDIDKMIKINLNGTLYCCKNVLPIMKKQRYGKIVNLSSIAGKLGGANASVYSATKAGVLELTACLAREYAEYDININCVLPGIIRTPLWNQMLVEMTEENHADKDVVFKSYTDTIPMKRPQEPVDIANAILFLCTDEASNITAQNLGIDGGQTY